MSFPPFRAVIAIRRRLIGAAVLVAATSLFGLRPMPTVAHADDNPLSPAAPAATAGSALTVEQIGDALDQYGKNATTTNGHTDYSITVKRGKWNLNIIVSLSPNGSIIWMDNNLTEVPTTDKLDTAALVNILKKNADIGPMFFAITSNGSLRLSYPLANANLTAATLRDRINDLASTIVNTEALWAGDVLVAKTK